MNVHVGGSSNLVALPYFTDLFDRDEMSDGKFSQGLSAGDSSDLVIIRPISEFMISSLIDESVLEDTKMALGARSGSAILKDQLDPLYLLIVKFQDIVCNTLPSVLPLYKGIYL